MMHFLKQHLAWAAVAVLTLGLLGQFGVYWADRPTSVTGHASWDLKPKSFDDVVAAADTAIEGQVESVAAGPDIVVPAKGEPSGEDRIPTQQITVRVMSADKGPFSAGTTVTVFRTGGERHSPATVPARGPVPANPGTYHQPDQAGGKAKADPNGPPPARTIPQDPAAPKPDVSAPVFQLDDDPPYNPGDHVYLLLRDGPNGTKAPVSPTGRYNIGADNRLHAVTDQAVAQTVEGRSVADAHAASQGRLHIPAPNVQKRVSTEGEPGMPTTGSQDRSGWIFTGAAVIALVTVGLVLRRRRA
jgi:hypothetical protein